MHDEKVQASVYSKLAWVTEKYRSRLRRHDLISSFVVELEKILGAQKALFFLANRLTNREFEVAEYGTRARKKSAPIAFAKYAGALKLMDARGGIFVAGPAMNGFLQEFLGEFGYTLGGGDRVHVLPIIPHSAVLGLFFFINAASLTPEVNLRHKSFRTITALAREILLEELKELQHRREVLERDILLRLAQKVSSSLRLETVLDTIIDSLRVVVPYDSAAIFILNQRTGEIDYQAARGYTREAKQKLRLKIGQGISGWVAKSGKIVNVPDVRKEPRYIMADPQTRSELAVPISRGRKILGVFNLESHRPRAFSSHQANLLQAFAGSAAVAIQNAKLYQLAVEKKELEKDLQIAHEIQRALLPRELPTSRKISVSAFNKPSRQIGGDFYDAVSFSDGNVALAVADVSGKGISGALMMATLHTIYRNELREGLGVDKIVERVNRKFSEHTTAGNFATFFQAVIDFKNNQLEYCSAGHNPAILMHKNGESEFLEATGIILGFVKDAKFEARRARFRQGDLIVIYSDGITEAENDNEELFGKDRLIELVRQLRDQSAAKIKSGIIRAVDNFHAKASAQDDVTLIVAKYLENAPPDAE